MLQKYGEQWINEQLITHVKDNGVNGVVIHFISGNTTTLERKEADAFLDNVAEKPQAEESKQ